VEVLGSQSRWLVIFAITFVALPAAALTARLLASARIRAGLPDREAWRRSLAEVGMVVGTVPWLVAILTPLPAEPKVYLIPFADLTDQFELGTLWALYQIGGNLLVFAAYGFLAPIRWPIGPLWVVLSAAAVSATAEILQGALHLGRVTSVDDVLVNATGAGLAALCSRPWWRRRR
jgi:hypothetical protein